MDNQYHAFDQWELLSEKCVEKNGNGCHSDDHECCVPWLRDVIYIVQSDDALDLSGHQVRASCDVDLPAQNTQPASDVRKKLLRWCWRELGNPVCCLELAAYSIGFMVAESAIVDEESGAERTAELSAKLLRPKDSQVLGTILCRDLHNGFRCCHQA